MKIMETFFLMEEKRAHSTLFFQDLLPRLITARCGTLPTPPGWTSHPFPECRAQKPRPTFRKFRV
jgi:hypothetical protein